MAVATVAAASPALTPARETHRWDHRPGVERTGWKVGQKVNATGRARIAYYMAGLQESGLNRWVVGDGGLARGTHQLHPEWGSLPQRLNVSYTARWFYRRAKQAGNRSLNDICQYVEISGNPSAYAKWEGEARRIVARQKRKDRRIKLRR